MIQTALPSFAIAMEGVSAGAPAGPAALANGKEIAADGAFALVLSRDAGMQVSSGMTLPGAGKNLPLAPLPHTVADECKSAPPHLSADDPDETTPLAEAAPAPQPAAQAALMDLALLSLHSAPDGTNPVRAGAPRSEGSAQPAPYHAGPSAPARMAARMVAPFVPRPEAKPAPMQSSPEQAVPAARPAMNGPTSASRALAERTGAITLTVALEAPDTAIAALPLAKPPLPPAVVAPPAPAMATEAAATSSKAPAVPEAAPVTAPLAEESALPSVERPAPRGASRRIAPSQQERAAPDAAPQDAEGPLSQNAGAARGPRPAESAPAHLVRAHGIAADLLVPLADAGSAPAAGPPTGGTMAPPVAMAVRPHDFSTLLDRLADARDASGVHSATVTVDHADFGAIGLRFDHSDSGLNVALSNADPDFGRAVAAASSSLLGSPDGAAGGQQGPQQGAQGQQTSGSDGRDDATAFSSRDQGQPQRHAPADPRESRRADPQRREAAAATGQDEPGPSRPGIYA